MHDHDGLDTMAASATLHCLSGCAVGEIAGLLIGTAAGLSNATTIAISVALAFVLGLSLSSLPLLNAGLAVRAALGLVVAADTLSIATMEVVDNLTMALIPGAMDAGLVNPRFWIGMALALVVAFVAAYPVNRLLLARGKGHALTHGYHQDGGASAGDGGRRRIPVPSSVALVAVIASFMIGGLVVSVADGLDAGTSGSPGSHPRSAATT